MIWKDINNIEGIPDGKYEVSDEGCVRRKGCRCVKPFHNRRYLMVKLVHLGIEKTVSVHRLVASAFIPNPEHRREVNHIDANPENNRVTNLEWATKDENMRHATSLHLMKGQKFGASVLSHPVAAYTLEGDYLITFSSGSEAIYVLSRGQRMNPIKIIAACRGRRETAYGFQWRYINPSKGVETKISAANMTTNRRAQIERKDKDTFRSALLSYIAEKR